MGLVGGAGVSAPWVEMEQVRQSIRIRAANFIAYPPLEMRGYMAVRDFASLLASGTAFQAVDGDASGRAPGEMWENQLAGTGHFLRVNSKGCPTVETWFSHI